MMRMAERTGLCQILDGDRQFDSHYRLCAEVLGKPLNSCCFCPASCDEFQVK